MSLLRKKAEKRLGYSDEKLILEHKFFKDIDFKRLLKKERMAPILPNIECESSLENFRASLRLAPLKLSFQNDHKQKNQSQSGQLLDFDFVEEDYVETAVALADSFSSNDWKSKKYVYSNTIKDLEKVIDAD